MHKSPVQNMATFEINGHSVQVTQDGETFAIQIDEQLTRFNFTAEQLDEFVKENT
jgi:hypothetical protein